MEELWIVHGDEGVRAALGRLARESAWGVRSGAPADGEFDGAPAPLAIALGVSGDPEEALEFARRHADRCARAGWILLRDPALPAERVDALFDGLGGTQLADPPTSGAFRSLLERARAAGGPAPLSLRRQRDALSRRLARHLGGLRPAGLSRARELGPDRLCVRGEPGTGRLLLARTVHALGAGPRDAFVSVPCDATLGLDALLGWVRAGGRSAAGLAVCLEDADTLAPAVQRALAARLGLGEPRPETLGARSVRWLATAEGALEPGLEAELVDFEIRLPPLRERPEAIAPFVRATAAAWCAERGRVPAAFSPEAIAVLERRPWPGNQRELESVVARTLAAGGPEPVPAAALRLDGGEARRRGDPTPPAGEARAAAPAVGDEREAPAAAAAGGERGAASAAGIEASRAAATAGAPAPSGSPPPASAAAAGEPTRTAGGPLPQAAGEGELVRTLAGAVAHSVRNPLVTIHTFTSLLPERFDDPEFRASFQAQVGADVERLESATERLSRFAAFGPPRPEAVDVGGMLEALLEERRPEIQARRLLVLQELDPTHPRAWVDPAMTRFALEGLLERALSWVPERADLFVASKHHAAGGLGGGPSVRLLLRFYSPGAGWDAGGPVSAVAHGDVSGRAAALEFLLADELVRAQGGELRVDNTQDDETLILLDLPVPR